MTDPSAKPSFQLDHVCLAVRRLDTAREILERTFGYVARTSPVENTRQKVRVQFLRKPGSIDLKLIEPCSADSPLVDFIKTRGGGLHHLAFKTESVPDGLAHLERKGLRIVTPPEPGEAFDEALIAFGLLGIGLNVELIDTEARRGELPPPHSN